jgi:hypothetical protein
MHLLDTPTRPLSPSLPSQEASRPSTRWVLQVRRWATLSVTSDLPSSSASPSRKPCASDATTAVTPTTRPDAEVSVPPLGAALADGHAAGARAPTATSRDDRLQPLRGGRRAGRRVGRWVGRRRGGNCRGRGARKDGRGAQRRAAAAGHPSTTSADAGGEDDLARGCLSWRRLTSAGDGGAVDIATRGEAGCGRRSGACVVRVCGMRAALWLRAPREGR